MPAFTESVVEEAALARLESDGWQARNGVAIARGEPGAEREVMLSQGASRALEAASR